MTLIISLALISLLIAFGQKDLRAHAGRWYAVATGLAIFTALSVWTGLPDRLPVFFRDAASLLIGGSLAGALFVAVMFAGAVPNGARLRRILLPIRGELSILACILTRGHNAAYGRHYFARLFGGEALSPSARAATICSLLMLMIMLPLFVTSFRCVRKKLSPLHWKRLQRFAYGFYALMYAHVLLMFGHSARLGNLSAKVNVLAYGLVFLTYAVLRIGKALQKRHALLARRLPVCGAVIMTLLCGMTLSGAPVRAAESSSPLTDGIYSGTGIGYNGRMTVSVTVEDGVIATIRVMGHVEDEPYMADTLEGIIPAVLAAQSTAVDIVSGATSSSAGLLDAIDAALGQARLGE